MQTLLILEPIKSQMILKLCVLFVFVEEREKERERKTKYFSIYWYT